MSNHGRDYLTGECSDKEKKEEVRKILIDAKPYGTGRFGSSCDFDGEATEIAEQFEGYSYGGISMTDIESVIQVTLYRWGCREWINGQDLVLARKIYNVYWPKDNPNGTG